METLTSDEVSATEEESAMDIALEEAPQKTQAKPRKELLPPYDGPVLEVRNVHRSFQTGSRIIHVLKGIDMEVKPQQLVMLKGRSGSGKTTLLNMLGGLDQPSSGEILFSGQPLQDWGISGERLCGVRKSGLFSSVCTHAFIICLGKCRAFAPHGGCTAIGMEGTSRSLSGLGWTDQTREAPTFEMSGEQQRVAIAKAIAHRPRLLLADEPTAELDSKMGAQVMTVFRNIIEVEQVTICMTTHDPTILEVADHVYEMADGRFLT